MTDTVLPEDPEPDPEQAAITRILAARPPPSSSVLVDAGDDAAVLQDGTAWTVDTLVDGQHFDEATPPEAVGYKLVAVSVSDLAAMGARPQHALLSLTLTGEDDAWLPGFCRGLEQALRRWSIHLVGGDTVRTRGPRVLTLQLGGAVVGSPLTRAGARPGDLLWVTGIPGLAGAGWRDPSPTPEALKALHRPVPPLEFALAVAEAGLASAAMDLSDGLGADVPRMAEASGVHLRVDPDRLPNHPALVRDPMGHRFAGGDDYQLLFTAPPAHTPRLRAVAQAHGVLLHDIGRATHGRGASLVQGPWPEGFRHFPRVPR